MPYGYPNDAWEAAKEEALSILVDRAPRRQPIPYSDLCAAIRAIHLDPHGSPIAHLLDELSRHENAVARGMISVLVVRKDNWKPGKGFFDLAAALGRDVSDEEKFWIEELERVAKSHGG